MRQTSASNGPCIAQATGFASDANRTQEQHPGAHAHLQPSAMSDTASRDTGVLDPGSIESMAASLPAAEASRIAAALSELTLSKQVHAAQGTGSKRTLVPLSACAGAWVSAAVGSTLNPAPL